MRPSILIYFFLLISFLSCTSNFDNSSTESIEGHEERISKEEFQALKEEYLKLFSKKQIEELEILSSVEHFEVNTIDNKTIVFGKNSEKPTVLLFFATWCPSCKGAIPDVDSVFGTHWSDRINILAIGREHEREALEKWAMKNNVKMNIVADPESRIYNQFASKFIPRLYVLDTRGNVLFQDYGWSEYSSKFAELALIAE